MSDNQAKDSFERMVALPEIGADLIPDGGTLMYMATVTQNANYGSLKTRF